MAPPSLQHNFQEAKLNGKLFFLLIKLTFCFHFFLFSIMLTHFLWFLSVLLKMDFQYLNNYCFRTVITLFPSIFVILLFLSLISFSCFLFFYFVCSSSTFHVSYFQIFTYLFNPFIHIIIYSFSIWPIFFHFIFIYLSLSFHFYFYTSTLSHAFLFSIPSFSLFFFIFTFSS